MSKRHIVALIIAGWLLILAGTVDAQSPSIYFADGQWTDLSAVFTANPTVIGYTNNKWGGTAYMYIWASFDVSQTFGIRMYEDQYTAEPNYGDQATLASETFDRGSDVLKARLSQDGVASWEEHLVGEYVYRLQVTAFDHGYHATYQITMASAARSAFGRAVVDTPSEAGRARVWVVVSDEIPTVIGNVHVIALSSTSVTITWETDEPASGFLFYGEEQENYPYEAEDTPAKTQHQVTLTDLTPGVTYYFIIDQTDAADNYTRSIEYTFTTDSGAAFVQKAFQFMVERTYDQRVQVPIQNSDGVAHRVQVSVSHPYEDLILDFVDAGSADRPLTLGPGEGRNILLAIHAQDATAASYDVTLKLMVDGVEDPARSATATIQVELPVLDLTFEELGTDEHTLGKTIRLTNQGGLLTDLTVRLGPGLTGKAMLRPLVEHFALATGKTVEFDVIPMLSANFISLNGEIHAGTALDSTVFPLEFTLGEGDQIFQAHENMKVWERVNTWYCSNRPQIQVRFQTPPPSTPNNLMDAYLEVNFSLPWNRNAYRNHDAHILVNDNEVGALLNTIPEGRYVFQIDSTYINHGLEAVNIVKFDTRHLNGGHYVVSADMRLLFHIPDYAMFVVAESQEDAAAFLRTYGIVGGSDLTISTDMITFSEERPDAGASVTIAAALDNLGMEDAADVLVRFYDGPPQNEEQIGTDLVLSSVPSQQRVPLETVWAIPPGNHTVYVVVDPEETITEIREDNNVAIRPISTSEADVESPTVLATSPGAEATDVGLEESVRIRFSEPMKNPTAEGAFSIIPDVFGSLTWEDSSLVFTPYAGLAEITTYTVTIGTSAEDLAGNGLIFDYRFAFTTGETSQEGAEATGIFVVTGSITRGHALAEESLPVTVRNQTTGAELSDVTGGTAGVGGYVVTFADLENNRAAAVGDEIEVIVYDETGNVLDQVSHTVATDEIAASLARMDIFLPDTTPPQISAVSVSWITSTFVIISWTTDELSNSLVEYGTTTYGLSATGAEGVTSHSVTLTGLSDSTTYHYRVGSTDVSGNTTWSEDHTFTTSLSQEGAEATGIFVVTGTITRDWSPVGERLNVVVRNQTTGAELSDATGGAAGVGGYVVTFSDLANNRAAAAGDEIEVIVYDETENVLDQVSHTVAADEIAASLARIDITLSDEGDTAPPQITAVSASWITTSSATVTWTTDEPSTSVVEYDTTAAYGLSTAGSEGVTSHSVLLTGLSDSTIYHYRVDSTDVNGNPAWSGDHTFITLEGDTAPPQITAVSASWITSSSATITWITNEPSTSVVEYDTTTAYGLSTEGSEGVTSHSVLLTGLSDSTIYHYRVGSTDVSGNPAWSEDRMFTTSLSQEGAETTGIFVVTGTIACSRALVKESLPVTVRNQTTGDSLSNVTGGAAGVGGYVVTFADLKNNRAAAIGDEIEVVVYDETGNMLDQVSHTVAADEIAASLARIDISLPDTAPPEISAVSVSWIASTFVIISWTTDEPSSSIVEYDTKTAYGLSAERAEGVTSHSVTLAGLSDSTTYHYRVGSTDVSGNRAWSGDHTFTTSLSQEGAEATGIFVVTGTITRDWSPVGEKLNVVVRNQTTEAELSDVTGGTAGVGGYVVTFSDLANNRAAAAGDEIEVIVYDETGNVLYRVSHTVAADEIPASVAPINITLPGEDDTRPPQISAVSASWITTSSATITWTTDEPSGSVVEYDTTTAYGLSAAGSEGAITTLHSVLLTGLSDSTTYRYRVGSTDVSGNPAWSEDHTFTTSLSQEGAEATGIFVVTGTITRDGFPVEERLGVVVQNQTVGAELSDVTGGAAGGGGYVVIFLDLANNRAAAVGDTIEVIVYDEEGNLLYRVRNHTVSADEIAASLVWIDIDLSVAVRESGEAISLQQAFALLQNFPNPFNASTILRYQLPEASEVRLRVYNLFGQEVRRLVDGKVKSGTHSVLWDGRDSSGRDVASGMYLYEMRAGDFVKVRNMVLMR
ncbi:MAG: fibronectin type III domain-containing protein [Candidatus Latescibacterota bacterium]